MIIEITTITIELIVIYWLFKRNNRLVGDMKILDFKLRSAYVKFGKSFEHFVPFIKNFPADKEKTVFLGMPIDFISFDDDKIRFIEVKTGQSSLSSKQKRIKRMIENKQVEFQEVRY